MIYGHITASDTYRALLNNPAWRLAFDWLRNCNRDTPLGIQRLQGDDIYVNVMTYRTVERAEARFESHRRYVDLQYCINGGEVIDWQLSTCLQGAGDYSEANDLQFYLPDDTATAVHLDAGKFGIFYPSDAHRPKCLDGRHSAVLKAVFKISYHLVNT